MNSQHVTSFTRPNIHYPQNPSFNTAMRMHQCPHCNCLNDRQCVYPSKIQKNNVGIYGTKDIYYDRLADRSQNSSRTNSSSNKQNLLETTKIFHPQKILFPPLRTLSPSIHATKVNIRFVSPQPIPINNFTFTTSNSEEPPKPKVLNKRSKTPVRKETTSIYTNNQIQTQTFSPPRKSLINPNKMNETNSPR